MCSSSGRSSTPFWKRIVSTAKLLRSSRRRSQLFHTCAFTETKLVTITTSECWSSSSRPSHGASPPPSRRVPEKLPFRVKYRDWITSPTCDGHLLYPLCSKLMLCMRCPSCTPVGDNVTSSIVSLGSARASNTKKKIS